MKRYFSADNDMGIGSNAWWLCETRGARTLDKFVLGLLKYLYLLCRVISRIFLGKRRRDKIWLKKNINFRDFLYRTTAFLGLKKYITLSLSVPKYGYTVCCPLSKEDFIVLTKHEDEIIDYFNPQAGDFVIDVGAHMGRYTIVSSKKVGNRGRVLSIEPHPYNFKLLKENVNANKISNVRLLNLAVSNIPGKTRIDSLAGPRGIYNAP